MVGDENNSKFMYFTRKIVCSIHKLQGKEIIAFSFDFVKKPPLSKDALSLEPPSGFSDVRKTQARAS